MSEGSNHYAAPLSRIVPPPAPDHGGNIDETLAGNARLGLGEVMGAAWERVHGIKGLIMGALALTYVVSLPISPLVAKPGRAPSLTSFALQLAVGVITYPLFAGMLMVAVRHVCGLPVSFNRLFAYYRFTLRILGMMILQGVFVALGTLVLVLPGVYLLVSYSLAMPLMVDRNLGMWDSLELSRLLVSKHWFTVFGVLLLAFVIFIVSGMLFLVPIIWTFPWLVLCVAVIYHRLAGLQSV